MGVILGLFFPAGMRLARQLSSQETPRYRALNGIFSVLCSSVAAFLAIHTGVSTNFCIAAACYAAVSLCTWRLSRRLRCGPQAAGRP